MNERVRLALMVSPLVVLGLVALFPTAGSGTVWALALLGAILASGYAFTRG